MTMDERVEAAKRAMQESKAWPAVFRPETAELLARVAIMAGAPEFCDEQSAQKKSPATGVSR